MHTRILRGGNESSTEIINKYNTVNRKENMSTTKHTDKDTPSGTEPFDTWRWRVYMASIHVKYKSISSP